MIEEKKGPDSESSGGRDLPEQSGDPPAIRWDDSQARTVYSNAFNVLAAKDEIVLLLGMKEARNSGLDEVTVRLSDRIVLSPINAKALLTQLNRFIQTYEAQYGSLDLHLPSPAPLSQAPSVSQKPFPQEDKKPDEEMGLIFRLVQGLQVEMGFEQSFKIVQATLLKNRFLLGVSKKEIGDQADDRLTEICRQMGMPKNLLEIFRQCLAQGNYLHFGFEQNEKTSLYKVYLEFWGRIKEEIRESKNRPDSKLMHLGLKWDVANPARQSLTRYTWYPWLSFQEIGQRVAHILGPHTGAIPKQAAGDLVSLARARGPDRDILYLEVTEEGNPRRSFDINVYRASLQVAEAYPLLSMLCRRHSVPFDTFHSLYEGIKTKRLGHLAAGVDREGNNFFTIYYGVEGRSGEKLTKPMEGEESVAGPTKYSLPSRRRHTVRVEETDDKARHLIRLVKDLGLRAAFERSFKFMDGFLLAGRFLLGFRRLASTAGQDEAIINVCRQIEMPEDYREMFQSELPEANIVLFGFEAGQKNRVYKVYLEFNARLAEAAKQDPRPESVVIHTGFKWDVSDPSRKTIAKYTAFPLFRAEEMAVRVLSRFYAGTKNNVYRIVDDILDLAGSRTRPGELLYFEVSEESNLRISFDINMYRADLQMAELYPLLVDMARHYGIGLGPFDELYEAVKTQKFGHLSAGTDREGKDFLTVYFSERGSSRATPPRVPKGSC